MEKFVELRKQYDTFIYHSADILADSFVFHFSFGKYHFYPKWTFNPVLLTNCSNMPLLQNAVFSLGMVELVSYWKAACAVNVEIRCGCLTAEQCKWWKKLYFNGLGEFFYINQIDTDIDSFMNIIPISSNATTFTDDSEPSGCLIPVGGGKDSVVTMELLKDKFVNSAYIINPRGATLDTAEVAGFTETNIIGVKRTIDKQLLELNKCGFLNGHTPFSAIVAFSAWIFAFLTNKRYITLSNESSANETNILGENVNHQYSKSTEFEADFRYYSGKYLSNKYEYFSFLRPLSEWQIMKIFTRYDMYFHIFQSCNVGSKTDVWCGKCAKCLYVFIMLAAFIDYQQVISIIGNDMLDDSVNEALFNGLVFPDYNKPFECVGTKNEINLALCSIYDKNCNKKVPLLLSKYMESVHEGAMPLENYYDSCNFLPQEFADILLEKLNETEIS